MGCMLEQFRAEMSAPRVAWLQLERRVHELEAAAAEQGARQSRQAEEDVAMGPTPAAEELFLELLRHGDALAAAGLTDDGSTLSEFFLDKRRAALNQLFSGGGGCGPPPLLSPAPARRAAPRAPTSPWQDAVPWQNNKNDSDNDKQKRWPGVAWRSGRCCALGLGRRWTRVGCLKSGRGGRGSTGVHQVPDRTGSQRNSKVAATKNTSTDTSSSSGIHATSPLTR